MDIANLNLDQLVGIPRSLEYNLTLGEMSIDWSDKYSNFIQFASSIGPNDVVNLHINSYGGYSHSASLICEAIKSSQATFIAHLNGVCWSAATFVALACDYFVVGDLVEFGIHSCQGGAGFDEVKKIKVRAKTLEEYNNRASRKYYTGFLTEKEIEAINDHGDEITFFADELRDRLNKYVEYRNSVNVAIPTLNDFSLEDLEEESLTLQEELKIVKGEITKRKKLTK